MTNQGTTRERVHIVYITQVDLTGSSGQNLYSRAVATELADHEKVELTIICPYPKYNSIKLFGRSDINILTIPEKTRGSLSWHARIQFSTAKELLQLNSQHPLDGIVTTLKPSNIMPPIFASLWNVPMVLLVEGMLVKNIANRSLFSGATTIAHSISFLNAISSSHVFTAYAEAQEWIKKYPRVNPDSITIFHHGVDPDIFEPMCKVDARNQLFDGSYEYDIVVGFVGSFKKYHEVDLLVQSVSRLNENDMDVGLVLVGEGPEKESIENLISDLGISESAIFTGFVDQDKVSKYISACDVLYGVIDPSHWGHPMKVYEYLSCGRPVVVYDDPELKFVDEHDLGITIETLSEEAVEDAFRDIFNLSKKEKKEIGQRARQYIVENHTWAVYADAIVKKINS